MDTLWILIGRFHPVLVHFPIALLTVGAGLRAWATVRPGDAAERHRAAGSTLMLLGLAGAVVACVAGFAYADDGQFRGEALAAVLRHRNAALIATGAGLLAVLVDRLKLGPAPAATALALVAAGVTGYAGHLGGVSVYGPDHYTVGPRDTAPVAGGDGQPAEVAPVVTVAPGQRIDFMRDVQPILDTRCYRCHDGRKRKGGLRLDKKKYFLEGGDGGPAVVAGKPMASKLFQMVNLPIDHEDYMPAKGDPIPQPEIDVLGRWIEQGAVWPDDA